MEIRVESLFRPKEQDMEVVYVLTSQDHSRDRDAACRGAGSDRWAAEGRKQNTYVTGMKIKYMGE